MASLGFIWHVAVLAMGLMATLNLVGIVLLAPVALKVLRDYEQQRRDGVREPRFDPRKVLKHPEQVDDTVWPEKDAVRK